MRAVLLETPRQQYGPDAETSHRLDAFFIEVAGRGHRGRAEREDDGRISGVEERLEFRLQRIGSVIEDESGTDTFGGQSGCGAASTREKSASVSVGENCPSNNG